MKIFICKSLALLAIFLCLLIGTFAAADEECPDCPKESATQPEKIKLDDVFVHAFGGGAVTYTPTSTIVDVDKYVKAGRVERVEDILMNIAGIDVLKSSGTPDPQAAVLMRGFDDTRFIVAMDGRPLTGSTGKANNSIDWSSLSLANIEKIEIIRGGASAAYESSEGGVINIITKKGTKRDTYAPKITYTQDYSANFDYAEPTSHGERITADGGKDNLTYFLNFGYQGDEGYLKNNAARAKDYSGSISYQFPFQGLLTLSKKVTWLHKENLVVNWPGVVGYDPDYPKVPEDADTFRNRGVSYYYPDRDIYKEKRTFNEDISYEQSIKNTTLKIYGYKTVNQDDDYYTTADGKQQSWGGHDQDEKHIGGGVNWSMDPSENNALMLGYNFKKTGAREMPGIFRIHAGYIEDFWRINDKWEMKSGLRVSRVRQNTYPYQLPDEDSKTRHKFRDWFVLPKLAVTYNIRPETNVYVSVSKDYDIPGC